MNILRASLTVTLLALLSRALGLGRDLAVTWSFGASVDTDAFYIASSFSNAAYVVVAAALASATIPLIVNEKSAAESTDHRSISNILNITIIALCIVVGAALLNSAEISRLLAGDASADLLARSEYFMLLVFPTIILLGSAGVLTGILNANSIFTPSAAAPSVLNAIVVLFILAFSQRLGVMAAILGTLAGSVVFFLLQMPAFYKVGYRHHWTISFRDQTIWRFAQAAFPAVAVALLLYAYAFVDMAVGARLGVGTVTAVTIAAKLIQLPQGVIAMGLTTATFPLISRLIGDGKIENATLLTARLSASILVAAVPATVIAVVLGDQIVSLVFGRGTFSDEAVNETSRIFRVMVAALPALALHVILLRISYAMRMWMIPLVACAVSFAVKLVAAVYLVDAHGVDALSYSTIIASYLNIMIMIVVLNRRLNRPFGSAFVLRCLRILVVSGLAGVGTVLCRMGVSRLELGWSVWVEFIGLSLAGVFLYLTLGALVLREEFFFIKNLRKHKLNA